MKSKTDRIKSMLDAGVSAAAIASKVGVSKSYVYAIKGRAKKAKAKGKGKVTLREVATAAHDAGANVTVSLHPLASQVGGNHYKDMVIQPIQFITANNLGFLEGCIVKRISRWKIKGGVEDLEKIKHEVDLLISAEQARQ